MESKLLHITDTLYTHCLYALCDIGIHAKHWNRKKLSDFLSNHGIVTTDNARAIYETIIDSPGSYLPYTIGYLEICRIRDTFQKAAGKYYSPLLFHTFLLDKNNRVIAVGNPVYNPKIKKLYFNIISGKKPFLPCNAEQRTNASLDKRFLDMGSFNWKQEQISDIILSNSGEELLAIEDVSASCGCITVEYLKEPIRPGQKLNLRIKYKAEHPEHFDKTVIIYCNAEGSPFRLKISGNAK